MPSPRFLGLALLILLLSFSVTTCASQIALGRPDQEFLTNDTQSRLRADYSPDAFTMRVGPTRPEIIAAAAEDEAFLLQSVTGEPVVRVQPNLIATPTPTPISAVSGTPTPSSATPAPTATRPPLDATATPFTPPTPLPQATPAGATPQPTAVVQAPTATPYVPPTPLASQPTRTPVPQTAGPTATPYVPPTPVVPPTRTPTPFVFLPTPTRTPTPFVVLPPSPTPLVFVPTPARTRTPTPGPLPPTATPIPGATNTPAPIATATSVPTASPTATTVPMPTAVVPAGNAWMLLHRGNVGGGSTPRRMSNAPDGQANDQIDINHGQVEVFQSIQPVAWASGGSDWVVQLVQRDKPNNAAPVSIAVWSQMGTCTSAGAVPTSQRYAASSTTVPSSVDHRGVAVSATASGAPQRSFAIGEVLCLSIAATSGSGSDDVHFYGDTFSTSGLTGRSALFGPFSFGTAPYLLHQATVGSNRSMSTSSSGTANDQVPVNAGSTVVFQSTSAILNASGLSPWPLLIVIREPLSLLGSAQAQVWKQGGACTTYASAPLASRFASGSFPLPTSLSSNNGVSVSLPGTGAAVSTLGPSEVLCLALSNTGLGNWTVRLDTPSGAGAAGKSSLGGPFSQVAGVRAYGLGSSSRDAAALLPALASLLAMLGPGCVVWLLNKRK